MSTGRVQQHLLANIDQLIINNRNQEIKELAERQQAVNELMKTVGQLVIDQAPEVDNILSNIQDANISIKKGNIALEKAEERQRSCCILL